MHTDPTESLTDSAKLSSEIVMGPDVTGRWFVRRRGDETAACCVQKPGPFGGGSLNSVDRHLWTREDKTGHR